MDSEIRALIQNCISYAVMMRASQIITEQQLQGIKKSLDVADPAVAIKLCNFVLSALNQKVEMGIRRAIENQRLIIV